MRIGMLLGSQGYPVEIERQIQQIVDAEADGFDSFWCAQVAGVDALTLIALAGQKTSRIEMGTAVVPTFPRHPLMLAQQAITTQAATDGRLVLGIGLSHRPAVEDRWGLSFDRPAQHMEEYLSVLRPLIHENNVDYSGDMFRVSGNIQGPKADPCPIMVAALAPRMLRIAGEMTEGTITWMVGRKNLETHIVPRISRAAEAAGRQKPRICVGLPIAVTDNPAEGYETAANSFQRYGELPSYRRMLDIEGVESPGEIAVVGDEESVERQLRSFADAGTTDLLASVFPVGDDQQGSVARTRALLKSLVGNI